jgi:UDP-N-acetylglucosamine--N-acetylmuramyl-(pentapeptide) pyrophosphoryl-undecaprenol N-acetylglucosamine transferase
VARIVLTGGGTGGHVYPALAIGDVLRRRGHTVLYYGDGERLEARVAPQRGYPFTAVAAPRYPRGGLLGKIGFGFRLLAAIWHARRQLDRDRIDAVLGVGGYISAPSILAAWTRGSGTVIHEANVVPGAANRLCARVADTVLLTYEGTRKRLKTKGPMVLVGVPVNQGILDGDRASAAARYGLDPTRPTALFVGGSLGAAQINELAIASAKLENREFQVLHLCGRKYHEDVLAALGKVPPGVAVVAYEDRMVDAYAMADLVVCRTGSSTLGELCAIGRAGLLLPSANVTDNHQEENARGLESVGAGEMLVERDWVLAEAVERVQSLMADDTLRTTMAAKAKSQARLDAAGLAADEIEKLIFG